MCCTESLNVLTSEELMRLLTESYQLILIDIERTVGTTDDPRRSQTLALYLSCGATTARSERKLRLPLPAVLVRTPAARPKSPTRDDTVRTPPVRACPFTPLLNLGLGMYLPPPMPVFPPLPNPPSSV